MGCPSVSYYSDPLGKAHALLWPIEKVGLCLACVYRIMDARGKLGEHKRSIRAILAS